MKYKLHCVVNAVGLPYYDTFHPDSERSWGIHRWRDVPKDGEHPNSCTGETLVKHEEELKSKGDRIVVAHIETQEVVSFRLEEL